MRLLEQGLLTGYPARSVDQPLVLEAVVVLAELRWTLVPEQSSLQVAAVAVLAELRWTLVPEQSSPRAAAEWMELAQELYWQQLTVAIDFVDLLAVKLSLSQRELSRPGQLAEQPFVALCSTDLESYTVLGSMAADTIAESEAGKLDLRQAMIDRLGRAQKLLVERMRCLR